MFTNILEAFLRFSPTSLRGALWSGFFLLAVGLLNQSANAQSPTFGSFATNTTNFLIFNPHPVSSSLTDIPTSDATDVFLDSDSDTLTAKQNLGITWNGLATVGGVTKWSFNPITPTNKGTYYLTLVASNGNSPTSPVTKRTVSIAVVNPDATVLPALSPASPSITVTQAPSTLFHTNFTTTNLPTAGGGAGFSSPWTNGAALGGLSVAPDGAGSEWKVNLQFYPKQAGTFEVPLILSNTVTGWTNSNNITVTVTAPTDLPGFSNLPASITSLLSTNQKTANLGGLSNAASQILIVSTDPANATQTYKIEAGFAVANGQTNGQLTFTPGLTPTNVTLGLVVSNAPTGLAGPTNYLTLNLIPLKPLQVRIRNQTGVDPGQIQIMQIDTGTNSTGVDTDGFPNAVYFLSNATSVALSNGVSTNLSALPQASDSDGSYRTFYFSNSVSGTLWFCLSNVPYVKGTNANPAVVNTKWSGLPFGNMELAYFGSGYDTADVTAINQLGLPIKLEMKTNPTSPQTMPDGLKGFTNPAQAATILKQGLQIPAAPWFGPAPNTNLLTLVGPSSATAGGLVMSAGGNTNVPGPGLAPGSLHLGWPGFTFPPMSAYVSKVATEQTNGTWTQPTVITKTVGDPQSPAASVNIFTFSGTLVFTANTNTGDPNYLTPVPWLTNVTIYRTNTGTGATTNITGLAVRYEPDKGSPATAWFSSYIYGAPPAYTSAVPSDNPSLRTGYVKLYANGAENFGAWFDANDQDNSHWSANVLDSFLNDIAFAFAGGFVHSPVMGWTNGWVYAPGGNTVLTNTNTGLPDTMIGTMVSSNWWNQTNLYSQLQPNSPVLSPTNKVTWYSSYGDILFQGAPNVYNHPISDRMKYIGFQPGLSLGAANLDTNVWLEITLMAPPASSGAGFLPAITSSTNVTNIWCNVGGTSPPISYQVTAVNTNGGGIYIGSLPPGLSYDPVTQMITGTLTTNASGYVNIGLMPYNSNNAAIAQLPIYLTASVAPNGLPPPNNLNMGIAYVAPTNGATVEGYSTGLYQLMASNNATSMKGTPQDCYFYATNGSLPRGLYLTNLVNSHSGDVVGYLYGIPVDATATNPVTLVATNPVGGYSNLVTLINNGYGTHESVVVANPPAYVGSNSVTLVSGQYTNLVLNYSNAPTYFTNHPSTPLPSGMSFQVTLNPEYGTAGPTFVPSLAGVPTGAAGTSTNIKVVAVNAYTTGSGPFWATGTNTNTITLNFVGAGGGGGGGGGSGLATWGGGSLPAVGTAAYSNALLQYAFGGSASYGAAGAQTNFGTASLSNISGLDYLILREIIRTNDANLTVWSEHTTNLTNTSWTSNSIQPTASVDQSQAMPGVNQVQEFKTPQGSDQRKFLRLKATYQNP